MKKYSTIIVLSSEITEDPGGPYKFENNQESFNYKIGKDPYQFSFKAIKKLFTEGACSNFILVGGEVETKKDGQKIKFLGINGTTIPKAEVMLHALVNSYKIPVENLIALKSASNTIGNAKEVVQYFKEKDVKDFSNIGILTCFHHLPRTIKTFKEITNFSFIPICSESIIYNEEFDLIKKFYTEEGLLLLLGKEKNENSEIKGMGDMERESYSPIFS